MAPSGMPAPSFLIGRAQGGLRGGLLLQPADHGARLLALLLLRRRARRRRRARVRLPSAALAWHSAETGPRNNVIRAAGASVGCEV